MNHQEKFNDWASTVLLKARESLNKDPIYRCQNINNEDECIARTFVTKLIIEESENNERLMGNLTMLHCFLIGIDKNE